MSSLKLQKAIINICNRAQRHCLWAKDEESSSTNALAAWSLVCRPKQHGGLGVRNLELQNKALLMKQLHKFYSRDDTPWVSLVWSLYGEGVPHAMTKRGSFWWRDIFSLVGEYRSITICNIKSGTSVLFWKDFWYQDTVLSQKFPRLFSYALDEDLSVADMTSMDTLGSVFALPLSVEAFQEWQEVSLLIEATPITDHLTDTRTFTWGTKYTPSKFYNFLFARLPRDEVLNAIWKSKALPKLKVFTWLLFMDRLNTLDIMQRKHWYVESGYECSICTDGVLETSQHLFFTCVFATQCWDFLGIQWDVNAQFTQVFAAAKTTFQGPCFFEVFACASWNIWKVRNEMVFNHIPATLARWKIGFQSDLLLHRFRVKSSKVQPLVEWLTSIFL
jgi:hypothetical protein